MVAEKAIVLCGNREIDWVSFQQLVQHLRLQPGVCLNMEMLVEDWICSIES
jgi:hypothetical protein